MIFLSKPKCPIYSLLRRGLLQLRWVDTPGGWEEGKIKVRGESHFLFLALLLPSFFFHWCLLTVASVAERAQFRKNFGVLR